MRYRWVDGVGPVVKTARRRSILERGGSGAEELN